MFKNRQDAGKQLAPLLSEYENRSDTIVLGLPRGGVIIAYEIATQLHLPLDVICPRKLGAPFNPELAIGAITEMGHPILNYSLIRQLGISETYLQEIQEKEKQQAQRRLNLFRQNRPPRNLKGKIVILVDDGLATGSTMKAAIQAVRQEGVIKVIVAIPVSPNDTLEEITELADGVACLATPPFFQAVGQFYQNFDQVEDGEVIQLLRPKENPSV